jgi:hypothetical protein
MTDKQINAAIAEACGWTEIHDSGIWHNFAPWGYPPEKPGQGGNSYNFLPDYCNDLNAMHDAEFELIYGKGTDYAKYLLEATNRHWTCDIEFFSANARQRAEAFLRTIGKWEEAND